MFNTIVIGIFWLLSGAIGSFLWPYSINTWLMWADKAQACTAWDGFFIGLIPILGSWSILASLGTWIATWFI